MRALLRVHASARADIEQYRNYLLEHDPGAALRFLDAAKRTFAMLVAHPHLGPFHQAESAKALGVRKKTVVGFGGYVVIYRVSGETLVEIVRVLHGSRDIPEILGYAK